ncbi:MAG: nicotinate-nucleotide adenylyltransferase [Gammaproteobacteria bacterium]
MRTIGVFGGTFAPIHNGHLRLAITARDRLGLSRVLLVPAASPPLREAPPIPPARRLRWVRRAIARQKGLRADARELRRRGPSYTIDTLESLRAQHPRAALCLLLGQDAARGLPRWRRWRELPGLVHLVFFDRPGEKPALPAALARLLRGRRARSAADLGRHRAGLWLRVRLPPTRVSGTQVRRRLARGLSVRGLVPDTVIADFTRKDLEAFRRS